MEAHRSLEDEDLRGANEVLKRAGCQSYLDVGRSRPTDTVGAHQKLIGLLWEVQENLSHPGLNSPEAFRKDLRELRLRFEIEARGDAGKIVVGCKSP